MNPLDIIFPSGIGDPNVAGAIAWVIFAWMILEYVWMVVTYSFRRFAWGQLWQLCELPFVLLQDRVKKVQQ